MLQGWDNPLLQYVCFMKTDIFYILQRIERKMTKKKICGITAAAVLIIAAAIGFFLEIRSETVAKKITPEEAQTIVNDGFDNVAVTKSLKYIADKNSITVNNMTYGDEKNVILDCTVKTLDVYGTISPEYNEFLSTNVRKGNGTMFKSALDFKMDFENRVLELLASAPEKSTDTTLVLYDTKAGWEIYADDAALNTIFGGILDIKSDVAEIKTIKLGDGSERAIESTNVNKGLIECFQTRVSGEKPDTAGVLGRIWNKIKADFDTNFIQHDRWKTIFKGLWVTLKLTFFAVIIGIILGFLVAFVRCAYIRNTKHGFLLKFFNAIAEIYLTITRGTPAVVQIMIIYFVIFMPLGVDKFLSAVVCFGLNSGAYVAEIVRGGIMSIDDGQTEAGRSLGFNYVQTMFYIVFPQAFKAVLPALANEFVVLLKETSVAFYIGLGDLMYSVNAIRSATYSPFMPLVSAALIYLVLVIVLSKLVNILERRLRSNER